MAKTANIYARIEPETKEKAEAILGMLGIPASNAINMFYKQIILTGGIPFELKVPSLVDVSKLSDKELEVELLKGIDDINEGRVKSVDEVFREIEKGYNLWLIK